VVICKQEPTLSGSSTLTFLPGLARSGSTQSLLGFANTLPELDDVSLLPLAVATGVAGGRAAGVLRGVEEDAEEGCRTMTGLAAGFALSP